MNKLFDILSQQNGLPFVDRRDAVYVHKLEDGGHKVVVKPSSKGAVAGAAAGAALGSAVPVLGTAIGGIIGGTIGLIFGPDD